MKQFIVLLAVLPIMLLFLAQFSLEQQNNMKVALITDIVYAAKEEAKQQGGFDKEALREELSSKLGISKDSIIIDAPGIHEIKRINEDGSRGIISYKIVVPIGKIRAGIKYYGISDKGEMGYKIESSSPSEYLGK